MFFCKKSDSIYLAASLYSIEKMNVLYISNTNILYGANRSLLDLLDEVIADKNISPYVLVKKKGGLDQELRKRNIKYFIVPYGPNAYCIHDHILIRLLKYFFYYGRTILGVIITSYLIKKYRIEVIHSNASNISIGAILSHLFNIRHVWHVRELLLDDYNLKYFHPRLMNKLFDEAFKNIAISDYVSNKRNINNCITIYNGLKVSNYLSNKEITMNEKKLKLLFVGNISEEKGVFDIVKALNYIVKSNDVSVELTIVGQENDFWEKKVKPYINTNRLSKRINFFGYQNDLSVIRHEADIALMCSKSEAFGRVTVESMLAKLLVIGARCGATEELVSDGVNGYLYDFGDYKGLASVILKAYSNIDESKRIIERAQEYAMQKYNMKDYIKKIMAIYNGI